MQCDNQDLEHSSSEYAGTGDAVGQHLRHDVGVEVVKAQGSSSFRLKGFWTCFSSTAAPQQEFAQDGKDADSLAGLAIECATLVDERSTTV